jgi:hypothetical protein
MGTVGRAAFSDDAFSLLHKRALLLLYYWRSHNECMGEICKFHNSSSLGWMVTSRISISPIII